MPGQYAAGGQMGQAMPQPMVQQPQQAVPQQPMPQQPMGQPMPQPMGPGTGQAGLGFLS